MYQPISVSHDQRGLPDFGSKASTLPKMATTSSDFPPGSATNRGVFHDSLISSTRHTSSPVFLFKATSDLLSTLALMKTRSPCTTGDVAEPQPFSPSPTSACQSCLPCRSKANTPDLPKNV